MSRIEIIYGQNQSNLRQTEYGLELRLEIPSLSEVCSEELVLPGGQYRRADEFHLIENDDQIMGVVLCKIDFPLQHQVYDLYYRLLNLCGERTLYRIWNYVPYINQDYRGLENYKSFSQGRSLAFEAVYGRDFEHKLGAASAVGQQSSWYAMVFFAGRDPAVHVENPEQVSAFCYPETYGPRPPSFARGTVLEHDHQALGYISGTASIRGCESHGVEDLNVQVETTLTNIGIVCRQMGLESGLEELTTLERFFKIYIRHESDLMRVREAVDQQLGLKDNAVYLLADICRADLALEIEGHFKRPKS